ncbi:MAG: replicative DNA helicase [Paludibacteraceae bacterium]|nr:replicative DNA helicase [Paludibacteraceae bacterium]
MATSTKNSKKKPTPTIVKVGANEIGKLPPQALDLEESVLGALMIEKEAYGQIADLLHPESFYSDKHRYIFEAVRALSNSDNPVDVLSVAQQLRKMGLLDEVGGVVYLSELTRRVASAAHLRYHAQIVAQKATARDLITIACQIEEKGYDETQDVDELIQEAEGRIFEISQRAQKREVTSITPVITEAFNRMRTASQNEGNISGIPSGFTELDKITSGWQRSDLVIIAARPAMGKTAFVLSMAKNIAVNFKIPVAIFSLEMSNVQLVNRLIMNVCEIEGNKIRNGRLTTAEWSKLDNRIQALKDAPIFVDDTPGLSITELRSKARKLVQDKTKGVQLIIIDYLQLMNANGFNFGSREQEVSIISRNLKGLAKELDIPIIALSQLSRAVEKRDSSNNSVDGKKPLLSDLRESGAIEQDADMVCFIHRPEYYKLYDDGNGKDLRGLGQIIVAKHRNGATDEIWLRFIGKYTRFQNESDEFEAEDENTYANVQFNRQQSKMNSLPAEADGASLDDDKLGDFKIDPF